MKIVCMCQGGNCRSVALAYHFKSLGHAAVAIGHSHSGEGLKDVLFDWADKIIVMEKHMCKYVPPQYQWKTLIFDVGPDIWFKGIDQDLLGKCKILTKKHGLN